MHGCRTAKHEMEERKVTQMLCLLMKHISIIRVFCPCNGHLAVGQKKSTFCLISCEPSKKKIFFFFFFVANICCKH